MTWLLRAAAEADLPAIYDMAKSTGGGFTNLPADRAKLRDKLAAAAAAFAGEGAGDERYLFVLADVDSGRTIGTCQIFARVGARHPFYSYRIDSFAQYSRELDRTVTAELLTLCTDHNGASEVGGLFLQAGERSGGTGALLARSRYLFMRMHRDRFADRTIAELRGVVDEGGESPFWDGVGGRFFGMSFREADDFNAVRGNQFIADLMPKTPIYKVMLPEAARHVVGVPHLSGRPAMRMLENEGFAFDRYVDIFDGGPTMAIATDAIATIRDAREAAVTAIVPDIPGAVRSIAAAGRLGGFRACLADIAPLGGGVAIDPSAAAALGVAIDDTLVHVAR